MEAAMKKVAVIMGSDSDAPVVSAAVDRLRSFGIPVEVRIISAHRTPDVAAEFASSAIGNGFGVIIAAAGKAAHLAGFIAAHTTLPVIGLPMKSSFMDGLDSLLSVVQMPTGVPVATVGVGAAENAGILAAQILAVSEPALAQALADFKADMTNKVKEKDAAYRAENC